MPLLPWDISGRMVWSWWSSGNGLRVCWPRQIEILDSRWLATGSHLGPVWGYLWETQPRVVHRKMGESHWQHSEHLLGWDCPCLEESLPFLLLPQLWQWCCALRQLEWCIVGSCSPSFHSIPLPSCIPVEVRKEKKICSQQIMFGGCECPEGSLQPPSALSHASPATLPAPRAQQLARW